MGKLTNTEVIQRLKTLYGEKYDYSKVNYINSRSYITLICPIHGEFQVNANNALRGKGDCAKCKLKFSNLDEFINEAKKTHGNRYNYSKVEYVNMSTKVIIICPEHGEFEQVARHHVNGNGCPMCSKNKKDTTESWTLKASVVHQNRYDYSKVNYVNNKSKVCIICPEHGDFEQLPGTHLKGIGCPKCGIIKRSNSNSSNTEEFIYKSKQIHGDKYDYSKVNYTKSSNKVTIICPKHGEFQQIAQDHLQSKGCPKCAYEQNGINSRITQEEFEHRARSRHGDKYSYGIYESMHKPMEIICPEHGIFMATPHNHIIDCGCPKCSESSGETLIRTYLEKNNIKHKCQYRLKLPKVIDDISLFILDFVVEYNNKKYIIEYNGIQHYQYVPHFHSGGIVDFEKQQRRDNLLRKLCNKSNIILIEIKYNYSNENVINLLNNYFKNEQI